MAQNSLAIDAWTFTVLIIMTEHDEVIRLYVRIFTVQATTRASNEITTNSILLLFTHHFVVVLSIRH